MKKFFTALKSGDWEERKGMFSLEVKGTGWAFDRIKEVFEQLAQDEAEKLSIVQEIMIRSTDHLRRIIAPVGRKEESRCPTCARIATISP